MEYISAEEFLKQPKEAQKVFIDWWNPSIGDLYLNTPGNREDFEQIVEVIYSQELANDAYNNKNCNMKESRGDYFPLFTEGQLRKFIEDKTGYKVETPWHGCYDIYLVDHLTGQEVIKDYSNLGTDLLQAYWKVACEIAKEQI